MAAREKDVDNPNIKSERLLILTCFIRELIVTEDWTLSEAVISQELHLSWDSRVQILLFNSNSKTADHILKLFTFNY